MIKNLAQEMREAASRKEIILEQKIRVTETEEIIEAEIPDAREEMSIIGKEWQKGCEKIFSGLKIIIGQTSGCKKTFKAT